MELEIECHRMRAWLTKTGCLKNQARPEVYPECNSQCLDWQDYIQQQHEKIRSPLPVVASVSQKPSEKPRIPVISCIRLGKDIFITTCNACRGRGKCHDIAECEGKAYIRKKDRIKVKLRDPGEVLEKLVAGLVAAAQAFLESIQKR